MKHGNDTLKIVGIKTKQGYFISDRPNDTYGGTGLTNYFINGEKPNKSFHNNWVIVNDEPKQIKKSKCQPNINHRYELIDTSLESDKFPLVLLRDEVQYYDEDEYEWVWKSKYAHLYSLYKFKSDSQPDILVELDFEYETILEMDEIKDTSGFSFTVQRTQWKHEGTTELTEKDVTHQLIDKIAFPDIVLTQKPAKFTSEQMYKIVREYIKQHIDYKYADITSDYNFCFAVKKRIPLTEPYEQKTEIMKNNGRPYKRPKYNTRYVSNRSVEVFEMTHAKDNYKNYTPIPAMVGDNLIDLKEKVDRYCEDLIKIINKPLVDCPHCHGDGVVHTERINTETFFK